VLVVWLVVGVVLLAVELHHLAFYALFAAVGCAAAAAVAGVAPDAVGLQAATAVAATGVGLVAVRPFVAKALDGRHHQLVVRGVHGGLVGHEAVTLDVVGDAHHQGHVRLTGERWLAVSGGDHAIPPDTAVVVTAVQGTTLVVWPVDGGVLPAVDPPDEPAPDGAEGRKT
jgi:membrane protein implicated in regulation of membrane protease activity